MFPLIARFLDASAVAAALRSPPTDADGEALHRAAAATPKVRDAFLALAGPVAATSRLHQEAVILAVRASVDRLDAHPTLGPLAREASAALAREGASAEEIHGLLGQVLLDEAFGYADDPASFDEALVAETLRSVPELAQVTAERVDDWLTAFAGTDVARRAVRLTVAEALLDAAWGDGPVPISVEHVDDALAAISRGTAAADWPAARDTLAELVAFLAGRGVVGPERARRLTEVITSAHFEADEDGGEDGPDPGGEDEG